MSGFRWKHAWSTRRGRAIAWTSAAVLCIAGGWLVNRLAFEERRLVAIELTEQHSSVVGPGSPDPPKDFVRSLLPAKYQRVVRAISLVGSASGLEDDPCSSLLPFDFGNLRYFPELVELSVLGRVDEEQLLSLTGLGNVEVLELDTNQATDAVVCHMAAICPKITWLVLRSGSATDASVSCICRMKNLETLLLQGTKISAQGVTRTPPALSHLREVITDADEAMVSGPEMEDLRRVPAN